MNSVQCIVSASHRGLCSYMLSLSLLSTRAWSKPQPVRNPVKRNLVRMFWVGGLTIFFLSLLYIITTVKHMTSFQYSLGDETQLEFLVNDTARLLHRCASISSYRMGNLTFFPIAVVLMVIFSWSTKRKSCAKRYCEGRPGKIDAFIV